MLLKVEHPKKWVAFLMNVDAWFMHIFADTFYSIMWNQFSIKRVYIIRAMIPAYIGAVVADISMTTLPVEAVEKQVSVVTIAMSTLLLLLMVFFLSLIAMVNEFLGKRPVRDQNLLAFGKRQKDYPFRIFMLAWLTWWVIDAFFTTSGPLHIAANAIQAILWSTLLTFDHAFIPENPPKRWSFSFKSAPKSKLAYQGSNG